MTKLLSTLEQDLNFYLKGLRDAADIINDNEVSKYPIFVFADSVMEIGVELFTPEKTGKAWYVYASTLENFATKGLIQSARIEPFKETYREHVSHFCLFTVTDAEAKFVFVDKDYDLKRGN